MYILYSYIVYRFKMNKNIYNEWFHRKPLDFRIPFLKNKHMIRAALDKKNKGYQMLSKYDMPNELSITIGVDIYEIHSLTEMKCIFKHILKKNIEKRRGIGHRFINYFSCEYAN
jgi:hypothetical protein